MMSAGRSFADEAASAPLQIAGAVNAYCALLAERAGFRALYLSGRRRGQRFVRPARSRHDDARTTCSRTCAASRARVRCRCSSMPIPAGARRSMSRARRASSPGPARPRCISRTRPGEALRPPSEQGARRGGGDVRPHQGRGRRPPVTRISWSWRARMLFAREGREAALERCAAYVEAGADMIFAEALTILDEYRPSRTRCPCPCSRISRSSA